ncbi:aminopeptidase [Candidatus Kaiserbacteria bacterium RIFCSPLOWO2_01_FULL_54_13]|uniref:Aminopeptidase n=1 Tax=Candidatus Kaiserbacteria bacterium RIFCSPLOWO2_01_FULL_54_13 TaxID=1798512 RepID=A0A1F6F2F4_9BACT|nr:MAG: aminopeptidase [Candidatus Kaiserbacteria bacterium RIFCSPLOWO2_01_FULL_54_13]
MHALARRLFPICRSLTGNGVRETLAILRKHIPLKIREIPSGTRVFDWTIPLEWNIRDAYVADERGSRVIDFKKHNLHVVGYSTPIDRKMPLEELQKHLYSLPAQPSAIPYVTSYYKRRWGFCLAHGDRLRLKKGIYRVVVDSTLKKGSLTYGELIIPGKRKEEVFFSTYVCHPSMANNELSGPVVLTELAKFIMRNPRRYTYRIIFIPETIGALAYLSRHAREMQKNTIAGFTITCVGDNRMYSYIPSRHGNTLADKVARRVLRRLHPKFKEWSFLDRGSDERQYCSMPFDLPVVSIMRTKYGTYPEYHTSLDDFRVVTPTGLEGAYRVYKACIEHLEQTRRYRAIIPGEPQLGKRHLYSTKGKSIDRRTKTYFDILAYADGTNDVEDLSKLIKVRAAEVYGAIKVLLNAKLLKEV